MSTTHARQLRVLPNRVRRSSPSEKATVNIYRPFFLAGVFTVLTAGCLLGAVALLGIAVNASYTVGAWAPYILAHANSQLYGWVGFFVMGFALQQHAPSQLRARLFHRLAYASLMLMGGGIAVRFLAEPLVAVDRSTWVPIGVGACLAQAAAVLLFIFNIGYTRHRTGDGLTWPTLFVFTALAWFVAVAVAEPFMFLGSHAEGQARVVFVAQWFPPYREAQFLGFVTMMIFGVALVKMNSCFGARESSKPLGLLGYALWNSGIVLRAGGWVFAFSEGLNAASRAPYHIGGGLLLAGAVALVAASRMFEPLKVTFSSQKFIRAAFSWLLVGTVLMALEPFHLSLIGEPFSHAYTGAIRHAITVGFISQMIVGVGMHVVARMNDVPPSLEKPLWTTFVLLNLGNAARVGLEIATDYSPAAFLPMGVTGVVELLGLSIWAAYVVRIMLSGGPHAAHRTARSATP
jgi:hypothetical protein